MKSKKVTGTRADKLLRNEFPILSSRQVEEALVAGLVLDGSGNKIKKGDRLADGTVLNVEKLRAHLDSLHLGNPKLRAEVVADCGGYLVIDKPAGMPSHPLGLFEHQTVTHWALAHYPELRREFASAAQPQLAPHRLDTGTSGLLIVAKTPEVFAEWREKFTAKKVQKKYLAWCWGHPTETSYRVSLPIAPVPGDRRRRRTMPRLDSGALPAESEVTIERVIEGEGLFLCAVECRTGVTHQVRVHLASLGFPLAGDVLYDAAFASRPWRPAHHQLRAMTLRAEGDSFEVSTENFRARVINAEPPSPLP